MYAFPIVSIEAVSLRMCSGGTPRAMRYSAMAVDSCSMKPPFAFGGGLWGVADPERTTYVEEEAAAWRLYSRRVKSRRDVTQGGRVPSSVMPPATTTIASYNPPPIPPPPPTMTPSPS